jgi:RimJ/RimL family protein N-acetyltransferase
MAVLENPRAELLIPGLTPVLRTERLVLRAPCLEDVDALVELAGDRRVAENTARIPHPYGPADAEQFIASTNRGGQISLLVTFDDAVIGSVGGGTLIGPLPEIGYWIGAPFWGNGYATEAAGAVLDYMFNHQDHAAIAAGARVTNPGSRRVLEKLGFTWTGVILMRVRALSTSVPVDRFRIDRETWIARRRKTRAAPTRRVGRA